MRRLGGVAVLVVFVLPSVCLGAPTQKKKTGHAPVKSKAKTAAPHTASSRTAASKTSLSKTGTGRASRRTARSHRYAPPQPHHYGPQSPTPERYEEIQKALADKGFFKGDVNGQWGPDSVDALRSFQQSQSLEADGKIGALSLIALGLGPKRVSAAKTETSATGAAQPQ